MGGKVDRSINNGTSPPIFRINGQNFHRIGSLLPTDGVQPKFAQLYIHDTANEIENRMQCVRGDSNQVGLHEEVVHDIKEVLDNNNVFVKSFRMAKKFLDCNPSAEIKMRLIGRRATDARTYTLPTASEVAALIVGDLEPTMGERDILVECKTGGLKRISELNPAYLPLQYPILFPYGEDGFKEDIRFSTTLTKQNWSRKSVSQREYFAFRVHERLTEISTLLYARRLFQQFLVDAYTIVESARLCYIRANQKGLRCDAYKGLSDALTRGYPNLFITFTCNPKWPEIQRFLEKRNLKAEDRPDIVCRVFKMKLDAMIKDIKKGKLFGRVKAVIYTIEFQKRGLPHAHILLFLEKHDDFSSPTFMDSIISAEIPDKRTSYFIRQLRNSWFMDLAVMLKGIHHYKAHINVEWCNQSQSIKYLFKYVNKGNDRVTAEFYKTTTDDIGNEVVDEINMYYDCRYISACEAMWRLFSSRESVAESMFNGWFIANQKYAEARQLSYIEMPTKFVWKKDSHEWHPRKKGFSIGRIFYVPPASDLCLTDDEKKNYGLLELDKLLEQQNRSLKDYHPMPIPEMTNSRLVQNRLLFEELSYDHEFLQQEALELCEKLTEEQRIIYDTVLDDISSKRGGLFFVYGYGGTGKTFMWRALSSELRSKGQLVLNMASSGIASLLLPGGQTAHSSCRIMRLTKNLRLNAMQDPVEQQATQEFANWIASIGDGKIGGPNDGYAEVEIPSTMLLPSNGDHIETIVRSTFPIFANGNSNASYLQGRAILAPTLEVVNSVNEYMSELHTAESRTYFSCDTICKADADAGILGDVHTPEFLNGIRASGIPNHALTLKIGSPVMLLRNIDHSVGLCNGTRLVITKLADRVIEAELMDGANKGTKVLIPRMSMSPSDTRLPFKFQRRQFPLMLSYAMTINKSQGQTLSHVGLLLKKPVFVHGQLYVAASRVNNPRGLKILIANESKTGATSTTNVVYHEIFNNL
ncbi:PREDICTED: uncharacterized protein LOC109152142 [Ipomoea nil]|uniref:uncharacterized protein LOC109152142 n=1 Tax=Ipomoea nil TaxID=35883 RepID=UPI000900AC8B|nr:PREDICTED: uncharacterized protein LOC109152142 [Ipomoea nil]